MENHPIIQEITQRVGISTGSMHSIIIENLYMRRMTVKFTQDVGRAVDALQMEIDQDMLDCANHKSDFMKTVITGDGFVAAA